MCTGAGAGSGSTRFRRRFQRRSGRLWCRARSGSTGFWRRFQRRSGRLWCRFNRVLEVPEKVPGSLGAKPSQVQQGSGEGSEEGRGGFPEKVWEALRVPKKVPKKVPEKVPEKVPGGSGAEPGQVQQGS